MMNWKRSSNLYLTSALAGFAAVAAASAVHAEPTFSFNPIIGATPQSVPNPTTTTATAPTIKRTASVGAGEPPALQTSGKSFSFNPTTGSTSPTTKRTASVGAGEPTALQTSGKSFSFNPTTGSTSPTAKRTGLSRSSSKSFSFNPISNSTSPSTNATSSNSSSSAISNNFSSISNAISSAGSSISGLSTSAISTADSAISGLSSGTLSSAPSFFGQKQIFYQFAPQMQRQDLLPVLVPETGTDPSQTFQGPTINGMTPSGNAPKVTAPPSQPQAKRYMPGQPVAGQPIIKVGGVVPAQVILPWNPVLTGVNPQIFNGIVNTGKAPLTDIGSYTNSANAALRAAQAQLDPNLASTQAAYQGGVQQTADSAGADQSAAFQGNLGDITHTLINVANESAASPAQSGQANRTQSQAIWIVQQMFKQFFMPVSLLLLLVGAVGSQTSNYVRYTFVESSEGAFEIAQAFDGIIRAIGALFLICSIQLVVSYFIDFGNAITEPIEQLIDQQTIVQWTQGFSDPTKNMSPAQAAQYSQNESTAAATGRVAFNTVQALLNSGLMVLTRYQVVMVCYLFLFGPIAAALWAWPAIGTAKMRMVLPAWLNGMSNLVMWRFWWCVILLCMSTRIHWLQDIGSYDPSSPWEPIVYTAFMAILAYVPFAALDFRPGDMVDRLLEKGKKAAG